MQFLVLISVLVACSAAPQFGSRPKSPAAPSAPQQRATPKAILIVKQAQDVSHDGSFNYDFETENGINSQASGQLKNAGTDTEALVITGSYSYVGDDGMPVLVTYVADENGYQAESSAIPTPPPVPEAIQRALDYLRSLPPSEDEKRSRK